MNRHDLESAPLPDEARECRPLLRTDLGDGLVVWQSGQLLDRGVTHAFTTRDGGVSTGPRATLDLAGRGSREGDELIAAEANLARLRAGLGVPDRTRTLLLHQIHGTVVHEDDGGPRPWPPLKGDILISDRPDGFLMVRVADCVPILLHDPKSGAVAAIHSGWRGTVEHASRAAVDGMKRSFGTRPGDLVAAIGPAIGPDRFEVGPEVAEAFDAETLGAFVRPGDPRPHVDLFGAVREDLIGCGVTPSRIDGTRICTHENEALCFSYRRDGPTGGRMAAVITPTGMPASAFPTPETGLFHE